MRSIRAVSFSRTAVIGALAAVQPYGAAAQTGPLTTAERSGFTATSRHADVMAFIAELQRLSPHVRVEPMATTAEGRVIPLLVIGDPVPASPAALRHDARAVVYLQANIHGGEVEGKEAAQMLARDLVLGGTPAYLDRLVILIAPIFNADGNERISAANRTNQVGPSQGVGERYNGQNLDLNRDGMKLETPEVRGLVRVLNRWDPVFFLDSHTHNGSYHQEPVTWVWGLNPNGDPEILSFMESVMLPEVERRMRETYGTLTIPHGDFVEPTEPARGWVPLGPEPRYLSNYVGLRNRLSVLNEQYPYVDFETRVRGAYGLFRAFLDYLHEHRDEVMRMVRDADRRALARGMAAGDTFVLATEARAIATPLTIRGYEMDVTDLGNGRRRVRPTERTRTFANVPYLARWAPTRSVRYAQGYLIATPEPDVLDNLLAHGITVERLVAPATARVERFTVTELTGARRSNQGHYTTSVQGEYGQVEREFAAGTLLVRTAQVLGPLAAALLEPESDDGLVTWNFFDRYLAAQWGNQPQPYPVYRVLEMPRLVTEVVPERGDSR
jgi:murein tripeptide amidase MpaA